MKITLRHFAFLALLCFAFFAVPLQAQSKSTQDAQLSGILLDASGGGIADVRVTAQLDGGSSTQVWSSTSTIDGAYALAFPAGRYNIQFTHPAFVPRDFVLDFS